MTSTRRNCLEVPTSDAERATFADFARHIGMATAVFARFAMFHYIETHDAKELGIQESRSCRDVPIASRASAKNARAVRSTARHRPGARAGFGGSQVPLRV